MSRSIVILAAGMGSRFGGLKQATGIGPNNEIISDYSIYDAILNGFSRVIFIIREEHLEIFKKITEKYQNKIEICFAFQKLDNIPSDVKIPEGRVKMWGTTHALLAAKEYVDGPFLMLNADDFYGRDSFVKAKSFFDNNTQENDYVAINYPFKAVSSENGAVKRGIVSLDDNKIIDIIESEIEITTKGNLAHPLNGDKEFFIKDNQPVSMNFIGLKPSIFKYLERDFDEFIHGEINEKVECLMPDTLKKCINRNEINLYNTVSSASWFGMTYKEDLEIVKKDILKLIDEGVYPKDLWG